MSSAHQWLFMRPPIEQPGKNGVASGERVGELGVPGDSTMAWHGLRAQDSALGPSGVCRAMLVLDAASAGTRDLLLEAAAPSAPGPGGARGGRTRCGLRVAAQRGGSRWCWPRDRRGWPHNGEAAHQWRTCGRGIGAGDEGEAVHGGGGVQRRQPAAAAARSSMLTAAAVHLSSGALSARGGGGS